MNCFKIETIDYSCHFGLLDKTLIWKPQGTLFKPHSKQLLHFVLFAWSHDLYVIGHMLFIYTKGHGHTIFTCQ